MTAALRLPRGSRFEHVVFLERKRDSRRPLCAQPHPQLFAAPASITSDQRGPSERLFLEWVFDQGGLNLAAYRPETLHRRVPACLRALRVNCIAEARRALERDRRQIPVAISALVIGVTSFFRDAGVFEVLRSMVLPALSKPPQRCRVWSVGCSDGEELYSVAMLLADAGMLASAEMLGTDCRGAAIAHAREALYDPTTLRNVPPECWEKYFVHEDVRLRITPEVRAAVRWRVADATQIVEPGFWDLILCRNMTMYLRPHVAGTLWNRLEHALRPGGFLILGKAERPIGAQRLSAVASCIYQRDNG